LTTTLLSAEVSSAVNPLRSQKKRGGGVAAGGCDAATGLWGLQVEWVLPWTRCLSWWLELPLRRISAKWDSSFKMKGEVGAIRWARLVVLTEAGRRRVGERASGEWQADALPGRWGLRLRAPWCGSGRRRKNNGLPILLPWVMHVGGVLFRSGTFLGPHTNGGGGLRWQAVALPGGWG
jgi:hypothetical protein